MRSCFTYSSFTGLNRKNNNSPVYLNQIFSPFFLLNTKYSVLNTIGGGQNADLLAAMPTTFPLLNEELKALSYLPQTDIL
ncbi:MAG: hypothetical protein FJ213_09630 [Ignavibacteria bacterium]|nr:hypothetical protein [Ignavibacteria bacterium]MBM4176414.1 hypothetical protein [Ignavibacteria bacterium]